MKKSLLPIGLLYGSTGILPGINVSAYIDGTELVTFPDEFGHANSGRVSIGSGLYNNIFDDLKVTPVDGYKPVVTRIDDHDAAIKYTGDWYRTVPDGYVHFNRTISRASVTEEDTSEKSFEFDFTGSSFAIIGRSDTYVIEIYLDGELYGTKNSAFGADARQCSCTVEVPDGEHNVKIKLVSGEITVDAIEY